jgi:S-formylglutathione hydrolase
VAARESNRPASDHGSDDVVRTVGWSQVQIDGRECDLFLPPATHEHGFVVLYLHDEDGSPALQTEQFSAIATQHHLPIVVPRCGASWWLDVTVPPFDKEVSPERYLLQSVLPWIEQHLQAEPKQIGLLGDGMGGQGVLKLAYKNPRTFPVTAAITPKIDFHYLMRDGHDLLCELFHEEEPARQRTAILFIQGLNWPQFQFFCCDPANYLWWDGADRLQMKLAASGIPFDCELELEADGDERKYYQQMLPRAMEYVAVHLERERLRLV